MKRCEIEPKPQFDDRERKADGVMEIDPSSLEQRLREWADSLPAGTLGAVHMGTLMSVARGMAPSEGSQQ